MTVIAIAVATGLSFADWMPSRAAATTVAVGDFWFGNSSSVGVPFVTNINRGDTVQWAWGTTRAHTVTETDSAFNPNGGTNIGDSGSIAGPYGPITFNTAGTFYYFCVLHPDDMRGQVNVAAPPAAAITVAVGDFWFGNSGSVGATFVVNINGGDTVQWVWQTTRAHTVTETDSAFSPNGGTNVGDSGSIAGPYGPITFNNAGTFYYFCILHPDDMRGQVNVTGSSGGGGSTGPAPGSVVGPRTSIIRIGYPEGARLFSPNNITITAGDTVNWSLAYGNHDVTSGYPSSPSYQSPGGKAGMPTTVSSFSRVFNTTGTYTFYCDEHAGDSDARIGDIDGSIRDGKMVGKIVVLAADATGPATSGVSVSPNPAAGVSSVTVSAVITDSGTVTSPIINAEAFINSVGTPGTGAFLPMTDGAWDEISESVSGSLSIAGLPAGSYSIYVRGQDQRGNWGATQSVSLSISSTGSGGGGTGGGAGTNTATVVVLSGSLSNQATPVAFANVSLTGVDTVISTSPLPWQAFDGTGTGSGWNVTVTSTDFTSPSSGIIGVSNFKVRLLSTAITTVSGGSPPTTRVPTFVALSTTAPLKVISASTGSGMGRYSYVPDFQLTITGSTRSGTYTASLAVTMNTGP
ncbi:MAG: hypothetical protein C0506_08920 [Anaerolinea sp.]|nr:hypothetical protein [Anaerolinea sp.]